MDEVILPHEFLTRIISQGRSAYPDECCGILAGEGSEAMSIYETTNIESSPVSYLIDTQEQFKIMKEIRGKGMRMIAIYHSHPISPPYPSSTDISLASYPDAAYIIAGFLDPDNPEVKAFEITDGRVREIPIKLTG